MFTKANILIEGRVQGVGFRFFTQRMAKFLNITGWVRNTSMGKVEVEAVGENSRIEEFILTLKNGPSLSHVTNVEVSKKTVDYNDYPSFEIRG